jgi:hypothetical protein
MRDGEVVGVAERLDLGDDLETVVLGPGGEAPHVVLLEVAAAAHAHVERGREAVRRAERDAFAELVHRLAVRVPLGDGAAPAHADLRVRVEPHPAAHLEHDPVPLLAQQEVAHVATREAELVAARQVEVDPAEGERGPVPHQGLAHGEALMAPAVDELQERRARVERAAVVASGEHGARVVHRQQVALGRLRHSRLHPGHGRRHERLRDLAHDEREPSLRRRPHGHRDRDAELVRELLGQQASGKLHAPVAIGHDDHRIAQEQPVVGVPGFLRDRPDRIAG